MSDSDDDDGDKACVQQSQSSSSQIEAVDGFTFDIPPSPLAASARPTNQSTEMQPSSLRHAEDDDCIIIIDSPEPQKSSQSRMVCLDLTDDGDKQPIPAAPCVPAQVERTYTSVTSRLLKMLPSTALPAQRYTEAHVVTSKTSVVSDKAVAEQGKPQKIRRAKAAAPTPAESSRAEAGDFASIPKTSQVLVQESAVPAKVTAPDSASTAPIKFAAPVLQSPQPRSDMYEKYSLLAPLSHSLDDYDVVLLVDERERKEIEQIKTGLADAGLLFEVQTLSAGDFLFTCRPKSRTGINGMFVLDCIIERKIAADLATSIMDGRWAEQKYRIKNSCLVNRMYLLEGELVTMGYAGPNINGSALKTAAIKTQVMFVTVTTVFVYSILTLPHFHRLMTILKCCGLVTSITQYQYFMHCTSKYLG
jgi:hypothetical protein